MKKSLCQRVQDRPFMTRLSTFAALFGILLTPALVLAQQSLAPLPPALPKTHTPQRTAPAIVPADLMTRLYIFADDSMEGREAGTTGNFKGTTYIASEVRRMGLSPAGDSGTYFQNLPFVISVLAPNALMHIDGTALTLGHDFLPVPPNNLSTHELQVVYGGPVSDEPNITEKQAAGKLVVFAIPLEAKKDPDAAFRRIPRISSAAGLALVALDVVTPQRLWRIQHPHSRFLPNAPTVQPGPGVLLLNNATALRLFGKPLDSLTPGTPGKTISVDYAFTDAPSPYPGRNVVAMIPGSDPALRNEYVALGAHNDHIGVKATPIDHDSIRVLNHIARIGGEDDPPADPSVEQIDTINAQLARLRKSERITQRPDSVYNGADDDGSGSVTLLEIAEHIAAMPVKPKRSILFVWHTGEEKGLWGSGWYTDHPTVPRDSIVAQLNIDMVGRGDASDFPTGGPNYLQLIGTRRLSTELGDLIETLNKADHYNFTFDYTFDAPGYPGQDYCRSDHYNYARYGIPIAFFTTGGHPDYHQLTDEPEYIDYTHLAHVASLVDDIAVHVANLDHRLVVDKPKPDPHAPCVQ